MGDDQKVGHGRFDPYLGKLEKTGLEGITMQAEEISRLRNRLAQTERQVRELASRLDHCDDSVSVQEVRPIGRELRAIIDPSDGEG